MIHTESALDVFQSGLTKTDIKVMADAAMESVLNNGNVLQVAEAISAMEMFIKEIKDKKEFKEFVREEAGKYPKGFTAQSGAKIECCEVGSKYDYSKCGDLMLNALENELTNLTEAINRRKEMLKAVPESGIEILFGDELIKVYPPSKSSTSSYKITLAK